MQLSWFETKVHVGGADNWTLIAQSQWSRYVMSKCTYIAEKCKYILGKIIILSGSLVWSSGSILLQSALFYYCFLVMSMEWSLQEQKVVLIIGLFIDFSRIVRLSCQRISLEIGKSRQNKYLAGW